MSRLGLSTRVMGWPVRLTAWSAGVSTTSPTRFLNRVPSAWSVWGIRVSTPVVAVKTGSRMPGSLASCALAAGARARTDVARVTAHARREGTGPKRVIMMPFSFPGFV